MSERGGEYYASQSAMPLDARNRMEELAFANGETYDAYLITEKDRSYFFSSRRCGVLGFVRWGRYVQVVGGLLADPEDRESLIREFVRFARSRWWHVSFYNVGRADAALLRRLGFQITKCGEEPVLRLDQVDWKGKEYAWLRRQENYCRRQRLSFREIDPDPHDPEYVHAVVPQLKRISQLHLAGTTHGRELKVYEGNFDPLELRRRRLFVVDDPCRIQALVVCNPCLSGRMWAVEIYRRLPDATRGVIPYAMMQTLRELKREGVVYASLSLVPCLRCGTPLASDSWRFRYLSLWWWRHFNFLFNVQGLYHFKSRFRPRYREMYVAALPKVTWLSMLALAMSWKLFHVSPFRLLRRCWRERGRGKRLAKPAWRAERLLRDVREPRRAGRLPLAAVGAQKDT